MKSSNKDVDTAFSGATNTIKTTPILDVPCGTCNNLVTTVPIFAKKGLCTECLACCCMPGIGIFFFLWQWITTYNCTTSVNRIEHYCPNCGAFLMVATPTVQGSCGCGWNRLFPTALANN